MSEEKPLVEVKVTNPVTYIKSWWNKVMGKEGIDFSFRIHPVTAIAMAGAIALVGFGAGRFSLDIPFLKYEPTKSPTPVASGGDALKDTAYTGTLQYSLATGKYYLLITSSSELITLNVPASIDLGDSVGKRILAVGIYNKSTRVLTVTDAKSLEILPKKPVVVSTSTPMPTPTETPIPTQTPTPEYSPLSTPAS